MMISVIIPVYNVERYLERCVNSLLTQSFREFELILVDDGSKDQSGVLCDQLAQRDPRVKVIHKVNGGLSSARNAGLDVAIGEYVTFIDSDDVIHPKYLEYLLTLCNDEKADISMGKLVRFSEEGELAAYCELIDRKQLMTGMETLRALFGQRDKVFNYISACCKLYRRSLFEGIRFPVGRLFEDEFTTYKLYHKAKKVVDSEAVLYFYFVNNEGITKNLSFLKYCDEYDAQWERLDHFKAHGLTDLYDLALCEFLRSGKWHFVESQKIEQTERVQTFRTQYITAATLAKQRKLIHIRSDYDYFVLAFPEKKIFYRILRKLMH